MARLSHKHEFARCIECGSLDLTVVDSRKSREYCRRRRKCLKCGFRQNTIEITLDDYEALVDERDKYKRNFKIVSSAIRIIKNEEQNG
jgi:transcriptional regulator NrdR family protein